MAEKSFEQNDKEISKEFLKRVKAKVSKAENSCEDVDISDILFSLVQKSYKEEKSNIERRSHEEIMFQKIRPEMPFQNWMIDLFPWKSSSSKAGYEKGQKNSKDSSIFDKCLKRLSKEEAEFPVDNGMEIKNKLESTMLKVLSYLQSNHKVFLNSNLIFTGSMYEGLKIQNIDEFDFMIELPELTNILEISTKSNSEMLSAKLLDVTLFDDLPISKVELHVEAIRTFFERINSKQSQDLEGGIPTTHSFQRSENHAKACFIKNDPENWFNMAITLRTLAIIIEETIQDHLPDDNWKILPRESKDHLITMKHSLLHCSAFTYDLSIGDNIVNIDVALAVPIKNLPLLMRQNEIAAKYLPEDFEERFIENPVLHHAIFRNSNTLRISLSCKEKDCFQKIDLDDPRKKCLRLVKYLCKNFITKLKYKDEEPSSLLNSYHIKTVFLFLLRKYPDDECWDFDHMSNRILEVFTILRECFTKRKLESYFIPHYNILRKYSFMDTNKRIIEKDVDVVVRDIDCLQELFSKMNQLNLEEALELFYNNIEDLKCSKIKELSYEEMNERFQTVVASNLW